VLAHLGSSLSYLDENVSNGQDYYYAVSATNAVGEGPASSIAVATPSSSIAVVLIAVLVVAVGAVMGVGYMMMRRRR
jgi:hypothetical protein